MPGGLRPAVEQRQVFARGAGANSVFQPKLGISTYFQLPLMAPVDCLSGIALRARRGVVTSAAEVSGRSARTPAAAPEPRFDPPPAPSVPAAASVAESVLPDHPKPKIAHPDVTGGPSPQVPSPELQPGDGSPPSPDAPRRLPPG